MRRTEVFDRILRRQAKLQDLLRKGEFHAPALRQARNWAYPVGKKLGYSDDGAKVKDVDESKMCASFVISSTRRDRHGDVVVPKGCLPHIENFRRNPRVFFGHNSHGLSIGSARTPEGELAVEVTDDEICSTVYFHGKTKESEQVYALVAAKELECSSIGFLPHCAELIEPEAESGSENEIVFDCGGFLFTEWDLLEWSVVAVPANADAIANHLSKGIIAGSTIAPSLRKSLEPYAAKPTIYVNGMRFTKGPDDVYPPYAPDYADATRNPDEEEKEPHDVQAIICSREFFDSVEDAAGWVTGAGYSADKPVEGAEADEDFVFIQFDAECCDRGTALRKDVDKGVMAVFCRAHSPEDEMPAADNKKPAEDKNAKKLAEKDKAKLLADELDDEEEMEAELEEEEEADVTEKPVEEEHPDMDDEVPHGVKFVRELQDKHKSLKEYVGRKRKSVEHPELKEYAEELEMELGERLEELDAFGKKHYPDHFKPEAKDDEAEEEAVTPEGEEEEDETEEKPEKSAPRKHCQKMVGIVKLSKKRLSVIRDAAEFLDEHADEENLKRSQKAAARHHAQKLGDMVKDHEPAMEEEEDAEAVEKPEDMKAILDAFNSLKVGQDKLNERFYELTGKAV
jgi:hypothetical protein